MDNTAKMTFLTLLIWVSHSAVHQVYHGAHRCKSIAQITKVVYQRKKINRADYATTLYRTEDGTWLTTIPDKQNSYTRDRHHKAF